MTMYTTYKCDRCGKEWLSTDKTEQPVSIGLNIDFGNPSGQPKQEYFLDKKDRAMWCRTCVMKTGIEKPYTEKDKQHAPEVPLSFEDRVCLLLEDLGFIRGNNEQ